MQAQLLRGCAEKYGGGSALPIRALGLRVHCGSTSGSATGLLVCSRVQWPVRFHAELDLA